MKPRCQIAVRRAYSADGQCAKINGLTLIRISGDRALVCKIHREALERGRSFGRYVAP